MVTIAAAPPSPPADAAPAAAVAAVIGSTTPTAPVVPKLFQGALKPLYPLYRAFELWSDADGLRMSAAMSFYGMLSLAPLLVLIVAALGLWLDREMLEASLIEQIGGVVGRQGAEVIGAALASAQEPGQGLIASLLAFGLLLVGATGVFAELQSALERLWTQGTGVAAVDAWWHTATLRLRGVAYILAFGFLMLVSTVIASLLSLLEAWAGSRFETKLLLTVLNQLISFVITTGLFVALMRMSAGPQPRLRHLLVGAAVGALLFGVGKHALALYLSTAAVVSAYGAAGSLVVLLMWIYFAAAVLLFAAAVARVMAERRGEFAPEPTPPPAAAVTGLQAEARAQGDSATAQGSTAAAAAALAGGATATPPLAASRARAPRPTASRDGLALLITAVAAFLLTRLKDESLPTTTKGKARKEKAAKDAAAEVSVQGEHARELERAAFERGRQQALAELPSETRVRRAHDDRGPEPETPAAWLGAAQVAGRALRQALRLAQQLQREEAEAPTLRSPRALRQWGHHAAESQLSRLSAQWHAWRQRRALAQARRLVARDVEALRDAVRRR